MDMANLKLFLHLSRSLHFHQTSQACFISPSGLTRSIQRLEEEVGARLLIRDNRTVSLTPTGERLQAYALRILDTWEEFLAEVEKNNGQLQGNLDIYCSVTASYSLLKPLLTRFRQDFPRVHLRLQTGDAAAALEKVLNGEADIGISARPDTLPARLEFKDRQQIPLVLIAPLSHCQIHDKLRQGEKWYNLPLILPRHGLARQRLTASLREQHIHPRIYAEVAGNEAIIAMVALGCGIGLIPELVLRESSQGKAVTCLRGVPGLPPYNVGFCVLKTRLKNPIVRAFWSEIEKTL